MSTGSDNFYITLFSNSSQNLFEKNSTSKFTVRLPKPIYVKENEAWEVGLVDCYHPVIIGTIEEGFDDEQDVIIFPTTTRKEFDWKVVMYTILHLSKRPELYTKRYFHEFLSIKNLKEFDVSPHLSKYKTTPDPKSANLIKVTPFNISPQYREATQNIDIIYLETNKKYTLRQVLWLILNYYHQIYLKAEKGDTAIFERLGILKEEDKTIAEILQLYALSIINFIRSYITNLWENTSNYLLLYTDIIKPNIVGEGFSKLLYCTMRRKEAVEDMIEVKNVKYYQLDKKFIEEISFYFADENSRQIVFENGFLPTCIILHFRRTM